MGERARRFFEDADSDEETFAYLVANFVALALERRGAASAAESGRRAR